MITVALQMTIYLPLQSNWSRINVQNSWVTRWQKGMCSSPFIFWQQISKKSLIFKDEKYTLLSSCLKYIPQACAPPHTSKFVILASFVACFAKRRQPRIIQEPNAMLWFHLSSQCKKLVSCHCSAELFWIGPRSRSSWGPYSFDCSYQPFWFLPQRYKSVLSQRKGKMFSMLPQSELKST